MANTLNTKSNTLSTLSNITASSIGTSAYWNGTVGGVGASTYTIKQPYEAVMTFKENPASLQVTGKVIINGLDLEERLKTIEKVLMIPERDATMETKYPSLKKKYDEYINALGKYRTFDAIKGE
jgi:hypothetical protein